MPKKCPRKCLTFSTKGFLNNVQKTAELVFFFFQRLFHRICLFCMYFGASLFSNLTIPFHQTKMSIYISHDDSGDACQTMVSSHFMQREKAVCIGRVNSTHFLNEKQKNSFSKGRCKWNEIHTPNPYIRCFTKWTAGSKVHIGEAEVQVQVGRMRVKWNLRR